MTQKASMQIFKKNDLGTSEIETVCQAGEICQSKYANFQKIIEKHHQI